MLSEPNYKLLKPVFIFFNVLNLLFVTFILIPFLTEAATGVSWWMWVLWATCIVWNIMMLSLFPFSKQFRDWLTSIMPVKIILIINSALILLFLYLK